MADQLLWVEMVLKLGTGLLLLVAPSLTAAALGLPRPGSAFWPRLLGAVLIGIGVASAMNGIVATGRGLALGGSLAINLAAAAFLLASAIVRPMPTRRGRAVIALVIGLLFLLSLVEIAAI